MKRILTIIAALTLAAATFTAKAQSIEPAGSYLFAEKDGQELYLDVYEPARGSQTSIDGKEKPTVIFVFGGGFKEGQRDAAYYSPWFKAMTDRGLRVISIDYRLGLKDAKTMGVRQADELHKAILMAVEDLYSATAFLIGNAEEFGVDPDNIVISGSSAGAITAMQAEYEICNNGSLTSILPEGFRYAGVMSFSGAVYSDSGKVSYKKDPCPILMFHGEEDRLVTYKQIRFFSKHFAGASWLAERFAKKGYNYSFYHFQNIAHEVCNSMLQNINEEMHFIEDNVMKGQKRIVDATVNDPSIKKASWGNAGPKDIY